MPRLQALDQKYVTGPAKDLLDGIQTELGFTPNLIRTMANSPAVLEAFVESSAALRKGVLTSRLRVQIALTVAEATGDRYCLAASTAFGKLAGLSEEAIIDSRRGRSPDSKEEAILQFASALVAQQGRVSDEDLTRLRRIGYGDADVAEIVANVALSIFTSYFNHVAGTQVDFPEAPNLPASVGNARE